MIGRIQTDVHRPLFNRLAEGNNNEPRPPPLDIAYSSINKPAKQTAVRGVPESAWSRPRAESCTTQSGASFTAARRDSRAAAGSGRPGRRPGRTGGRCTSG